MRRAGLDPLGVQTVDLESCSGRGLTPDEANARARVVLAASIGRAEAYPGSRPENLKAVLASAAQKVSRRALFTLPPLSYVTAPTIDRRLCNADEGCDQCVQACPSGALAPDGDVIRIDRGPCIGCGACVAACPQRAVEFPGWSPAELEAQVSCLARADVDARDVLFTCKNADAPPGPWWISVGVPCAAIVSAGAILQTIAAGATSVGVRSCGKECASGMGCAVQGRVEFCRQLMVRLGGAEESERVQALGPDGPGRTCETPPPPAAEGRSGGSLRLFGHGVAAEAVHELADRYATEDLDLEHRDSPLGSVHIDGNSCTGCATCAMACPTDALSYGRRDDHMVIVVDASLCTACGECERLCPERESGAIVVTRGVRLNEISQALRPLFEDHQASCEQCGRPIAPDRLMAGIATLLGDEYERLELARRCPDCRSS